MTESPRHRARMLVLQGLYAAEIGGLPADEVWQEIILNDKLSEKTCQFAKALFDKTIESRARTDQVIAQLAQHWVLERIAVIDQIILRMAMTEINNMPDVPVKVVLNEAIELAKEFSTAESSSFINGLLDSFVKNPPESPSV